MALRWVCLTCCGLISVYAAPIVTPEWTIDFGESMSQPVAYPDAEHATAVLLTASSGRLRLIGPDGHVLSTMRLDLPATTSAIPVAFSGGAEPAIVAADVAGSIYCFRRDGTRLWKYARDGKATDFRHLSVADLDGHGSPDVLLTDSRGHLFAVDGRGRLKLDITTTTFRLSTAVAADLDGDDRAEIVFGTEDNEVYAVRGDGSLLWHTDLPARVGRALPVIAWLRPGNPVVLISTPFIGQFQGLFALTGTTGTLLWKAQSLLQSYESTLVADIDEDGIPEVLYGDKSTRVFCVDRDGKKRWAVQLDGRGIFFAPVAAQLEEHGPAVLFQVVRAAGVNGKSLYVLGPDGNTLEALPLHRGGSSAPLLCRWRTGGVVLLVASGPGTVTRYRLAQGPEARILTWSAQPAAKARPARVPANSIESGSSRIPAVLGTNRLTAESHDAAVVSFRVVDPSGAVHVTLRKPESSEKVEGTFVAGVPGIYQETTTWYRSDNSSIREDRRLYRAAAKEVSPQLPSVGERYKEFALYLSEELAALRGVAEQSGNPGDYDAAHHQASYAAALLKAVEKSPPSGPLLVHAVQNPWAQHTSQSLLDGEIITSSPVRVRMLGNEYESAAIAITNITARTVTLVLRESGLPEEALQFRSVPMVVPNTTGIPQEDPLPLLARDGTLTLQAGETREIWLTFHSRSLIAGLHKAVIEAAIPERSDPPVEIPIEVTVSPVRLPEGFHYKHCNWLYLSSIKDEQVLNATIRDAVEHGTNVFNIPQPTVEVSCIGDVLRGDAASADRLMRKLPGAFFLIDGSVNVHWLAGCHPDVSTQDHAYANGLHWLAAHMRELGVDKSDYAVYLQDEPGLMGHDAAFERYVASVKRVKRADPEIQVYSNPAGGAMPEMLAPLDGLVDVWCPDLHLFRLRPAEFTTLFHKARNFWHYEAPSDQRRLDPLGFYRVKPWIAFQLGMNGGGYWVYSQTDYYAPDPARNTEYGVVYPTPQGPVTSKRWEASRDGSEDYELLVMLRQAAQNSNAPKAKQALSLIEEAVAFATKGQDEATDIGRQLKTYAPDFMRWMKYRTQLIEMAEKVIPE